MSKTKRDLDRCQRCNGKFRVRKGRVEMLLIPTGELICWKCMAKRTCTICGKLIGTDHKCEP